MRRDRAGRPMDDTGTGTGPGAGRRAPRADPVPGTGTRRNFSQIFRGGDRNLDETNERNLPTLLVKSGPPPSHFLAPGGALGRLGFLY